MPKLSCSEASMENEKNNVSGFKHWLLKDYKEDKKTIIQNSFAYNNVAREIRNIHLKGSNIVESGGTTWSRSVHSSCTCTLQSETGMNNYKLGKLFRLWGQAEGSKERKCTDIDEASTIMIQDPSPRTGQDVHFSTSLPETFLKLSVQRKKHWTHLCPLV